MANYSNGTDTGTIGAHPSYLDTFNNSIGPFRQTYNGLRRTSSGVTAYDETADTILTHINNYNQNLDKILTEDNSSVQTVPNTVVLRDANGDAFVRTLFVRSLTFLEPIGGEDPDDPITTIPLINGGRLEANDA